MRLHRDLEVRGPWSLATSRRFWEGFAPAALTLEQPEEALTTVFVADADFGRVSTTVRQDGATARVEVEGDGDLDAAVEQVARFLCLDVDATAWPEVGRRDPVIGEAQRRLPGLRPCGFHSPYEAAAWCVLSQRVRVSQGAALRQSLIERYGDRGAFPAPAALLRTDLDLPGRKADYLRAVAGAALDGLLDGRALRALEPGEATERVRTVRGLGPFAADLVVIRGANHPDALATVERRLLAEVARRYDGRPLAEVAEAWRPFRTWAQVHLRVLAGEGQPSRLR